MKNKTRREFLKFTGKVVALAGVAAVAPKKALAKPKKPPKENQISLWTDDGSLEWGTGELPEIQLPLELSRVKKP